MKKFLIALIALILTTNFAYSKDDIKSLEHEQNKISYLNIDYWENYGDDLLIEHLKNLFEQNYDLKIAQIKLKENEKLVSLQFANELPQLSFDGYITRDFRSSVQKFGSMSIPSYAQNNFQLPLSASYEIDIWGKNRLKTKSAKQLYEIEKQNERTRYISLTSDFTSDYFNLIKTDELLKIQDELIEIQKEIVEKIEFKNQTGLCSINEVLAEKKLLTTFYEEKNNLEDKKEALENALKSYLALREGHIERKNFNDIEINFVPEKLNTDIIEKRPDFIASELNLKKSGYDVRIARKELLPNFIIFGQIGLNSYHFSDLFKSSTQLANAGIIPTFDIFSGGRKMAFLKLKKYQYDEALNQYQKTIVEDIKEVNNAVCEVKTAKKNYLEANERYDIQNRIFSLVKDKKEIGASSGLDVLYAKQGSLFSRKESVSNTVNYLISTITLYKSTGGQNLFELKEENL